MRADYAKYTVEDANHSIARVLVNVRKFAHREERLFVATEGVSKREEEDCYLGKAPDERHDR